MGAYTLDILHEDLIYIIECIAEDLTGEATFEVSQIQDRLNACSECEMIGRIEIQQELAQIRRMLVLNQRCAGMICNLRQRVKNTIEVTLQRPLMYNYAPPFKAGGS
jgi:hypothetical protein